LHRRRGRCFSISSPRQKTVRCRTSWRQSPAFAAITLVNVIEEEFGIEMDLDQLADLDSFSRIEEYVTREMQLS
jgi:hypothetical protein